MVSMRWLFRGAMFPRRYVLDIDLRRGSVRATWCILLGHAALGCADATWNDAGATSIVAPARRIRIRHAEPSPPASDDDAVDPADAAPRDAALDTGTSR